MVHSRTSLAKALDRIAAEGTISITESRDAIIVNQLTGPQAKEVGGLLKSDGWLAIEVSDEGGPLSEAMLAGASDGLRLVAKRPSPIPEGIDAVLTQVGFVRLLERPKVSNVVWVEGLTDVIDTMSVRYAPWGHVGDFKPKMEVGNPVRVVRTLSSAAVPPGPIGRWLLQDGATDTSASVLEPWREKAAAYLAYAISQEVEESGSLLLRGPPPARFSISGADKLSLPEFSLLQSTTIWVYENDRELENRHALLSAEIARTSLRGGELTDLVQTMAPAMESARIAYNFGVNQQSKDTLRALADLRKAVSDDTAKVSETTRALSTAVIGAVFGNIGLVVARLSLSATAPYVREAALIVAWILAVYVGGMIGSGFHYISIQRQLRENWRHKLYRFLSADDYASMVDRPVARAERAFKIASFIGAVMVVLSLVAVYLIVQPMTPIAPAPVVPQSQ